MIIKGFGLKKYFKMGFLVKHNKSVDERLLEKCKMREEGNFQAKTSPGVQDFIFCAKKSGNK